MTPSAEAMAAYAALPEGEQCFKYAWCAGYDAMRACLGEPVAWTDIHELHNWGMNGRALIWNERKQDMDIPLFALPEPKP